MKRVFSIVFLLIATAIGLFWPLLGAAGSSSSSSTGSDPVVITHYQAALSVSADGLLTARETITGEFPFGRHGIFRFWDVRDAADSHNRYTPTVTSITMDNGPIPYELLWQSGHRYRVAKIGDANNYVEPGQHTFVIDYTIPGAISPASAGTGTYASNEGNPAGAESAFYWNVVAPGWQNDIIKADVTITLPSAALQVQCTAGTRAAPHRGPCTIAGTGTTTVKFSAQNIPPNTGMTARIPMALPAPARTSLPWPVSFDQIFGTSVPLAALVGVLSAAILGLGAWLGLRTREEKPGYPVMYAPPEGLGPVQTVYAESEGTGSSALTATILYLADRQLVKLEHRSDDSWLVTGIGTPEAWAATDAVSRAVGASLGVMQPGMWFLSDGSKEAGAKLTAAQSTISSGVVTWSHDAQLSVTDKQAGCARGFWYLAFLGAIVGFIGWKWPTMFGLPFAAFVIGGVALTARGALERRTPAGRRTWSEAGGFQRMLSTPSSEERFDFSARKDMFIPFIPFATAFGVADRWAEKYRMEMNEEPPVPMWYPVGYYGGGSSFYSSGGGFASFDNSLSSAISSYEASQSSSSGGGGGGGFGGGGGGGGGGSW